MRVRFQADNDLKLSIVRGVTRREPSIDFRTAQSAGLDGVPDIEVLGIAASERRILVSHDLDTMPSAFERFAAGRECPGVLLVPQSIPIARAIELLILLWEASEAEEWAGRLALVPSLATLSSVPG